jgi:hypothetical protein
MKLVTAHRAPKSAEDVNGTPVFDPIPDMTELLAEAAAAGLSADHEAFLSFHLRCDNRESWERAVAAAQDQWQVSAYSQPDGHMLRLSCRTALTEHDVEGHRARIVDFASSYDATWESVVVEDLDQPTVWQALAASAEETEPAVEPVEEPVIIPVRRLGGGDVA